MSKGKDYFMEMEDKLVHQFKEKRREVILLKADLHERGQRLVDAGKTLQTTPWTLSPNAVDIAMDGQKIVELISVLREAQAETTRLYETLKQISVALVEGLRLD